MTKRPLLILALFLLIGSLPLTAFTLGNDNIKGWWLLIDGWLDMEHLNGLSWLANPLFVAAFVLLLTGRRLALRIALYLSGAAALFALSFLAIREIPDIFSPETVTRNAGYWLWFFSMIALLLSAITARRQLRIIQ
jgi:hypothetical protein